MVESSQEKQIQVQKGNYAGLKKLFDQNQEEHRIEMKELKDKNRLLEDERDYERELKKAAFLKVAELERELTAVRETRANEPGAEKRLGTKERGPRQTPGRGRVPAREGSPHRSTNEGLQARKRTAGFASNRSHASKRSLNEDAASYTPKQKRVRFADNGNGASKAVIVHARPCEFCKSKKETCVGRPGGRCDPCRRFHRGCGYSNSGRAPSSSSARASREDQDQVPDSGPDMSDQESLFED